PVVAPLGDERPLRQCSTAGPGPRRRPGDPAQQRSMNALTEPVAQRLRQLIEAVPDPSAARHYFEVLRQDAPEGYTRIVNSAAALRCAVTVFSYSRFLAESVWRDPGRLLHVANSGTFYRALSVDDYRDRLLHFLGTRAEAIDFARFRRRHLLRILLRDVHG